MITALCAFHGNVNDLPSFAVGVVIGNDPTPYTPISYIGTRSLVLNYPTIAHRYIQIPYINLSQKTLTIEVWLHPMMTALMNDHGIFGQCDSDSVCLSLSLRNGRFALSFDAMDSKDVTLVGSTVNQANYWLHLAVVDDAVLYRQRIDVHGQLNALSSGVVDPFEGKSFGAITSIGTTISVLYGITYFQG